MILLVWFVVNLRKSSAAVKAWVSEALVLLCSLTCVVVVVCVCPGGDPADDVRGSDLRPPLDRRQRGRDLPQKDQICGGGPSGAAAGHVNALLPLTRHVLISHRKVTTHNPHLYTRDGRVRICID